MYIIFQLCQISLDQAVKETEPPSKNSEPHPASICHPYLQLPQALECPKPQTAQDWNSL